MARKKKIDLKKFGGTEKLGDMKMHGHDHDIQTVEVQSDTKLQDDKGEGGYAIIRKFTFGMNPKAFQEHPPTKQELFNYHLKGIEVMLWRDGWKVFDGSPPQLTLDWKKLQYSIFVAAIPQNKFNTINAKPRTLAEIAKN